MMVYASMCDMDSFLRVYIPPIFKERISKACRFVVSVCHVLLAYITIRLSLLWLDDLELIS